MAKAVNPNEDKVRKGELVELLLKDFAFKDTRAEWVLKQKLEALPEGVLEDLHEVFEDHKEGDLVLFRNY